MSCRRSLSLLLTRSKAICNSQNNTLRWSASNQIRNFASVQLQGDTSGLPDSIKRVGVSQKFPNEYPGQVYSFNWCLNGDGVTPLKKSAFRICKPLDLKVAGLAVPTTMPLKVSPAASSKMPEAGSSDALTFEQFDESSQSVRDYLSLSDHLYCPEGHVPGTRTGVRIITNSDTLAPQLLAYLERAPRKEPAESLPITVYVLGGSDQPAFAGYAIEEVEVPIDVPESEEDDDWHDGSGYQYIQHEAKSVASVVVADSAAPSLDVIVAGIELCQKALAEDEQSRQAEKEAAEKEKAES